MEWEIVMGLEVHVELATKTKIFCSCTTEFGGAPNTHCCPVCTGMPGTLPVLNKKVLEYAVKAGLALGCEITRYNKFDRKNYFYPDLPKAYQISQLYLPFARNGRVDFITRSKKPGFVRIHEIHMEEDAGKLVHSAFGDATFPDYNRCGVPLIEIVSEPDFRSAEEVIAYLEKLKTTFEYLGISDCKMQEGSMRADVNLSVRKKGEQEFGTRTEMKNINSFKAIERAIAFESARQIEVLENGGRITQETRRWDDNKGKTYAMRSKENAQDYRYFPEPDIPPVSISEETIKEYLDNMPEFSYEKIARYQSQYGIAEADAAIIAGSKYLASLFEKTTELCGDTKEVRFWIMSQIMYFMNERGVQPEEITLTAEKFAQFIDTVKSGRINKQTGKTVFEAMFFAEGDFDIEKYIKDNDLLQVDDTAAIEEAVRKVIAANPAAAEQFKNGEKKVVGFFVGQVMKETRGKAKPETVNKTVLSELGKL